MPKFHVLRKTYRDSVTLMQLASKLARLPGISNASASMATPANLDLLREAGTDVGGVQAGPNDLLIMLEGEPAAVDAALAEAQKLLSDRGESEELGERAAGQKRAPRSIAMALAEARAGLALISVPGEYAAAEALKAVNLGLNVMLFSDNVALADEVMLKRQADARGLIVMGPDCGTAIIGGVPLAFANKVRAGPIGLVGASGTGLQQVTVLIDRMGGGITQAIGTGGRDLKTEVGGLSMLAGLRALAADADTRVIVLISKPPAEQIAQHILGEARQAGKPVVVNFLGADAQALTAGNLHGAYTLEDAARVAVALSEGRMPAVVQSVASGSVPKLAGGQRYIRGLYSGGTFCYEATLLLQAELDNVYSNTHVGRAKDLDDAWRSREHTLVDLGDDLFTRGRPHPMIDHRLRNERILQEAADPEVAVILLDVVLGYGSHPDPAAEMRAAITVARDTARKAGREIAFVAHVCGTEADPQNLTRQSSALSGMGVLLANSNAQAVRLAARIARG
jgi:succinyl-CoA synthetase alpha subunit